MHLLLSSRYWITFFKRIVIFDFNRTKNLRLPFLLGFLQRRIVRQVVKEAVLIIDLPLQTDRWVNDSQLFWSGHILLCEIPVAGMKRGQYS